MSAQTRGFLFQRSSWYRDSGRQHEGFGLRSHCPDDGKGRIYEAGRGSGSDDQGPWPTHFPRRGSQQQQQSIFGHYRGLGHGTYPRTPEDYPLIQDFVPGEDYCHTALYNHGEQIAGMTYHNVRSFPRGTGAGALRETVALPEADEASSRLLSHLQWHGIAQLDFRKGNDGRVYLIEVNPHFFGGLPQAVAANVDYPHLLFRIASGEKVEPPDVDYSVRTEAPIVGLLATLDEIAHDDRVWNRFQKVHR